MEVIRRFLELSKRHSVDLEAIRRASSSFGTLPLELLLIITSSLRPESVACLSLSCHYLYSYIGPEALELLQEAGHPRVHFIRLLERDLPLHIVCSECRKLHSMRLAKKYRPVHSAPSYNISRSRCTEADLEKDVMTSILQIFSSTIFRMALKAHLLGHDTGTFLKLLSYETKIVVRIGYLAQISATCRIQDGSFLIRTQQVLMIPPLLHVCVPCYHPVDVCPHIRLATIVLLKNFAEGNLHSVIKRCLLPLYSHHLYFAIYYNRLILVSFLNH
jgi:hypothetical protein